MTTDDTQRILIGLDGSDGSIDALRRGAQIAEALDMRLEAITTWEYPSILGDYAPYAEWSPESDAKQIATTAITQAFAASPPHRLTYRTVEGPAARVLIEQSEDAYMLIVGSRGHGGFLGLLLGSVSAACAEHAHCPVLVMH